MSRTLGYIRSNIIAVPLLQSIAFAVKWGEGNKHTY